jgi:Peptidase A4 family
VTRLPRHVLPAAASVAAAALLAAPAGAAVLSSNWSGYVAHAPSGRSFTSVSAGWTVPAAACAPGKETHSAVWVGLGGYREGARALEQIGTDTDCTAKGRPIYSSWVELLPAAARPLALKVSPGDLLIASVTVSGRHATLRLRDLTTGRRYSTTRRLSSVDVSTAEWIVEAPSGCTAAGGCRTLELTDFGSVSFANATATASGYTGTVADEAWAKTELVLRQRAPEGAPRGPRAVVSATPTALEGGSFTVSYAPAAGPAPAAPALPGAVVP